VVAVIAVVLLIAVAVAKTQNDDEKCHHSGFCIIENNAIAYGVDRYAYQKGLFVIRPSGDTVEIVNDQKFKPITW